MKSHRLAGSLGIVSRWPRPTRPQYRIRQPSRPATQHARYQQELPRVKANDSVEFEVRAGEVHALLGENGAGKTTLMNILYGLYQPDAGEIRYRGEVVTFRSPRDAIACGLGLVAQHFHLARRHTVAENIALGLANTPFIFPTRALRERLRALGDHYGLGVNPTPGYGSSLPESGSGSRSSKP